jgi:hypothetical protein
MASNQYVWEFNFCVLEFGRILQKVRDFTDDEWLWPLSMISNSTPSQSWLPFQDRLFQRYHSCCLEFKDDPGNFLWRPSQRLRLTRVRCQINRPSISKAELIIMDQEAPNHFVEWNSTFLMRMSIGPMSLVSGLRGNYPMIPYKKVNDPCR